MTRFRRGQPRPASGERFDDIRPDPSRVGGVAEAPFVRLPDPATLFAARARRLTWLAQDHTLSAYLSFLAGVVATQAACVAAMPAPAPVPAAQVRGNADFTKTLAWLLDHLTLDGAPGAARSAAASLRAMSQAEQFEVAADILEGSYRADLVAQSLFVAAALQVHLARLAVQLDAGAVTPSAAGVCPVCGGAPVSSMVVGWTQASKARYCACSLCGTLWNHVRIKCTACGATGGIAYYTIEDGPNTIGIETCTTCRSYIKHMQQHEDAALDPIADDVASYALDLLAREQSFTRSSLNPLFLQVAP